MRRQEINSTEVFVLNHGQHYFVETSKNVYIKAKFSASNSGIYLGEWELNERDFLLFDQVISVLIPDNHDDVFEDIRAWATERGLYTTGDPKTQFVKLAEEMGELAVSILKDEKSDFIDAVGDCVVVLTNLAKLKGLNIEDCIQEAYNQIKNRKGSMQNGTFVKS